MDGAADPDEDADAPAPGRGRAAPYLTAMGLIFAGLLGWLLTDWSWPWQVVVVLLGVAVLAFWKSVPKAHDEGRQPAGRAGIPVLPNK